MNDVTIEKRNRKTAVVTTKSKKKWCYSMTKKDSSFAFALFEDSEELAMIAVSRYEQQGHICTIPAFKNRVKSTIPLTLNQKRNGGKR